MHYVYKITVGTDMVYHGYTSKLPEDRFQEHLKVARSKWSHNSKLYPALSKAKDYRFEKIGEYDTELKALMGEIVAIRNTPPEFRLNISPGGEGSTMQVLTKEVNGALQFKVVNKKRAGFNGKHSEAAKAKMSRAKKGKPGRPHSTRTKRKISRANTGVRLSKEHKAKISKAASNRVITAETKAKMSESHKKLKTSEVREAVSKFHGKPVSILGEVYNSRRKAAQAIGMSESGLYKRLTSNNFPDYFWT